MPSIKWQHVINSPLVSAKIISLASVRSLQAIINFIISPSHPLSLRTALVRAWYGTSFAGNSDIWYSEPISHGVQKIETEGGSTYVIPPMKLEDLKDADVVYIYSHGGGMFIGHALQYLEEYKRWTAFAAERGKKIVILSVSYPLSVQKRWPAQREAFLGVYSWALSQSIPASRIIFGGDSAGANLALLSLIYLRDQNTTPMPAAIVLHSPYIDMTGAETQHTSRINYDYILTFPDIVDYMNDVLRPEGTPRDTPEISALLAKDVSGLPPQLVFWSSTEILATDSSRWVERSQAAGNEVVEFKRLGQLHTFSLGWPFVGKAMERECDELWMEFVFDHVQVR